MPIELFIYVDVRTSNAISLLKWMNRTQIDRPSAHFQIAEAILIRQAGIRLNGRTISF